MVKERDHLMDAPRYLEMEILNIGSDAHIRSRVSELQTVVAERVIEKTALNRAWVLTRLRENVDRSMQVTAVLDSEANRCLSASANGRQQGAWS